MPRRRLRLTVRSLRAALAACVAALLLSAPGCAAIKATQQPGKKNLQVLSEGTPRSHVIAELGAPLWSEQRDGTTVDVFAFKQGYTKGVKAGRALVHGAADVVTGGLWEVVGIPAESLADGSDVKLEIRYDRKRNVEVVEVISGDEVVHPRPLLARLRKRDTSTDVARREEAPSESPDDEQATTQ